MALQTKTISAKGSKGHHTFYLDVIEDSTSTANNTSSISYKFRIGATTYNWSSWGDSIKYTLKIGSHTITGSIPEIPKSKAYTIKSGSGLSVAHDTDGSKSIAISFSVDDGADKSYTSGDASKSDTMTLTKIPRYLTINTFNITNITETSVVVNWTTSDPRSGTYYSLDGGTTWVGSATYGETLASDNKSGSFNIQGLTANKQYSIKIKIKRTDSGLWTESSAKNITTYNYPHCTTAPNFTIGDSVNLEFYNPLNRTFTMSILGNDNSTILEVSMSDTSRSSAGGETSVANLYKSIPSAKSGTYKVKVVYGSSTITKTGGTYSIKGTEKPTVGSISYVDSNSTTVAITGNNQDIVQNKSNLKVTYTSATAKNSASISKYTFTLNGVTKESTSAGGTIDFGLVNSSSNLELVMVVTDSRGLTSQATKTIKMLAHSNPNAIVTLERLNNYEDETYLTVDGSISSVNSKNKMTIKYRYKVSGGSYPSTFTTIDDNKKQTLTLDKNNMYIFQIVVTDSFGSSYNKEHALGKGVFPLFIDTVLNSVGINCFPTSESNLFVNNAIVVNSGSDENGTWIKFYDGTMICHQMVKTGTYSTSTCCSEVTWTFPVAFKNLNSIRVFAQAKGGNEYAYFCLASVDVETACKIQLKGMPQTEIRYIDTSGRSVDVIAIGKWK